MKYDELKKLQLDILIKVDKFCKENNIRYSLDSGTLIGAIRHRGYIPWDDDIDIIMPRPDYERFINSFNGYDKFLYVLAPDLNWNFYAPYANVCDNRTILLEGTNSHRGIEMGVKIDIFPIDGVPDREDSYLESLHKIQHLNLVLYYKRVDLLKWKKSTAKDNLIMLRRKMKYVLFSYKFYQRKLHKIATRVPFEKSKFAANITFAQTVNRLDTNAFRKYILTDFECYRFSILERYDEWLRKMYGDYMQLPPEEERVPHHGFTAYWKDGFGPEDR